MTKSLAIALLLLVIPPCTAAHHGLLIIIIRRRHWYNTVFAGHHQPLKVWISCLYLVGLNVSNNQIAKELDLCTSDVHAMTTLLRTGVVERKPEVTLEGEVEFDEVYIVAVHKGHPEALKKSAASSTKEKA